MGKGTNNPTDIKSEMKFRRQMRKPSRKKHFGEHLSLRLYYVNPESINRKAYYRSIHCSELLIPTVDGNLTTQRCRCRWCPICASIQTAKLIAGYGPQLNELDDLWFVTLTRPTVPADKLAEQIDIFQKKWQAITKDRHWKDNKPIGLRKMECTMRPRGLYHYHFHVIIQGRENAQWVYKKWLELNPESSCRAQDCRPIIKGQYIELFKYFTKLVVKTKSGKRLPIDFARLDFILTTIKRKRVYQPFGGLQKVSEDITDDERIMGNEVPDELCRLWSWMTNVGYVDFRDGEILTGDWKLPEWVEELTRKTNGEDIE